MILKEDQVEGSHRNISGLMSLATAACYTLLSIGYFSFFQSLLDVLRSQDIYAVSNDLVATVLITFVFLQVIGLISGLTLQKKNQWLAKGLLLGFSTVVVLSLVAMCGQFMELSKHRGY